MMFVFSVMQMQNNGTKAIEGFGNQKSLEAAGELRNKIFI